VTATERARQTDHHSGVANLFRQARAALVRIAASPARAEKPRKRGGEDKGRTTWKKPLERRFVRARLQGKCAKARTAFKRGKAVMAARAPPADPFAAANLADPDILDCMNPYGVPP
jgi:hypothetical protein